MDGLKIGEDVLVLENFDGATTQGKKGIIISFGSKFYNIKFIDNVCDGSGKIKSWYVPKRIVVPLVKKKKSSSYICSYCFKEISKTISKKNGLCSECKKHINKKVVLNEVM